MEPATTMGAYCICAIATSTKVVSCLNTLFHLGHHVQYGFTVIEDVLRTSQGVGRCVYSICHEARRKRTTNLQLLQSIINSIDTIHTSAISAGDLSLFRDIRYFLVTVQTVKND